jgi:hypothetical protein
MNWNLLLALGAQLVISYISKLAGAIFGVIVTTGILIWGITVFAQGGAMSFMFQRQSEAEFITICLIWWLGSIGQAYVALQEAKRLRGFVPKAITPVPTAARKGGSAGTVNERPVPYSNPGMPSRPDIKDSSLPRE